MKTLLIATQNQAKIKEIKHGLKSLLKNKITLITLEDLKIKKGPEETGKTFEENALLKAKYYADKLSLPAIADDGGIAIKSLNGEPGVKSRMWLGYEVPDQKLIDHTLYKLKEFTPNKRQAYLETCLCFYDPETGETFYEKERINGFIALKQSKKSEKGYPFRSLFMININGKQKYYDSLNSKETKQLNHRLIALQRLLPKISKHLLK
ncbi:MAG: non-canonical purine NTP pyrophosphatase [bacterium]